MKNGVLTIGPAVLDIGVKNYGDFFQTGSFCVNFFDEMNLNAGGNGSNISIRLAKKAINVWLLTSIGNDYAGTIIKEELKRSGVCQDFVQVLPSRRSASNIIFVQPDGEKRLLEYRGTNDFLNVENFDRLEALMAKIEFVIIVGLGVMPKIELNIKEIIRFFKSHGVKIVVATAANAEPVHKLIVNGLLRHTDFLITNEPESLLASNQIDFTCASDFFLAHGIANSIITRGDKGVHFKNRKGCINLPAHAVQAIDASGAGDAFLSTFVEVLMRTQSADKALDKANKEAAYSTTMFGAH